MRYREAESREKLGKLPQVLRTNDCVPGAPDQKGADNNPQQQYVRTTVPFKRRQKQKQLQPLLSPKPASWQKKIKLKPL